MPEHLGATPGSAEDDRTRRSRTRRVVAITTVVALGGFLFGYDTGVISGALAFITDAFSLTPLSSGVVVSSIVVGAMVGALASGRLSDRFGRRTMVIVASVVFILGSVLAAIAPSFGALVAARVVLGLAIGSASALVPVFIAEVAPPAARGRLVAVNQLLITIGIAVAYLVGFAFTDSGNWRAMFAIGAVPAIALGAGMLAMPESPRWLLANGREARAREVLAQLRPAESVEGEVQEIRRVGTEGPGRLRDLLHRWMAPALVAGIGLQILGQATGVNTVVYYAPVIFGNAGLGASAAILATVGIGIVNVVMTIVGMALVDRIGRKALLISGVAVMVLALVALAVTMTIGGLSEATGVVAFVCVAVYIAAVAASLNVVVFIIPSEIYPLHARGSAMSVTLFSNWTMSFVVSLSFLPLLDLLGTAGAFWMYAFFCAALIVFAVRLIPETRGRSLEQIERDLRKRAAAGGGA